MLQYTFKKVIVFIITLPLIFANMLADPRLFRSKQPNGEWITLKFNGDGLFHYETDQNGYTVMKKNGYTVYAQLNEESGELEPTNLRVGKVLPSKFNLSKKLLPSRETIDKKCGEFCESEVEEPGDDQHGRKLAISNGVLKNLVVLICFSDHDVASQPTQSDYDMFFNSEGTETIHNSDNVQISRTGSVRDVFLTSSYGNLKLESLVYPWIQVSQPESYYTNGNSGLGSRLHEAMKEALNVIDKSGFNWLDFDQNRDGKIDAITFLHSGYGAELGGIDCNKQSVDDRVWSHKWAMQEWNSRMINNHSVSISRYHISPAKWGTCGNTITRIGVIAHETGHFLGLEDHYDGRVGVGIANYGLMGNAWGFDLSQEYPPIMSPWSKMRLGWLEPIVISESKTYEIPLSCDNPVVYKIEDGFPEGEYLLIENRQPKKHDKKMPQGGLLVWHIDELATIENEGYPGQDGWPQNGNHYKLALLQADGDYDLERGADYGDASDVFHAGGVDSIGPAGTSKGKPFPNTNSYQGGNIRSTGIVISDISSSGDVMSFRLSNEHRIENVLETTFRGGNGQAGNMFDVIAKKNLTIYSMDIHTSSETNVNVEVWSKTGTWEGNEDNAQNWTFRGKQTVLGQGKGAKTRVDGFDEIYMEQGTRYALYVTIDDRLMIYSDGEGQGLETASDDNLSIMTGAGKKYKFGKTINNRIWNGSLRHRLV